MTREAKSSPAATVKQPPRKRVTKAKVKTVKKARAVLKKAEAAAKSKPGPREQVGQPWKAAGVSRATYYRNLKQGAGNE